MLFSEDKRASVIICSGNSLAVAVRFEETDYPPIVVAKARGLNALILKKTAQYSEIPIKENPQLARKLIPIKKDLFIPEIYWEDIAYIITELICKNKSGNEEKRKKIKPLRASNSPLSDTLQYLHLYKITIEIGAVLADEKTTAAIVEKIKEIRKVIAADYGIILPVVNIRDNPKIENEEYRILIKNVETARGKARKEAVQEIKEKLYATIKKNIAEFSGYQETHNKLISFKKNNTELVNRVLEIYDIGEINAVLKNLLTEHVSIINLADILETLISFEESPKKKIRFLTEKIREKLGSQIGMQYAKFIDGEYKLFALTLNQKLEKLIIDSKYEDLHGDIINALNPEIYKKWLDALSFAIEFAREKGHTPVILCTSDARYLVKESVLREFPELDVLSVNEIPIGINCEKLLEITIPEEFLETDQEESSSALEELENLTGLAEVKK